MWERIKRIKEIHDSNETIAGKLMMLVDMYQKPFNDIKKLYLSSRERGTDMFAELVMYEIKKYLKGGR